MVQIQSYIYLGTVGGKYRRACMCRAHGALLTLFLAILYNIIYVAIYINDSTLHVHAMAHYYLTACPDMHY